MKRSFWGHGSVFGLYLACALAARAETFTFSTIAGIPDSLGDEDGSNNVARLQSPTGVALGNAGSIFLSDGNAVRLVSPVGTSWVVGTLAGVAASHGYVDGTNADALFDSPQGIAIDPAGNLFVADTINNAIRKIAPSGTNWVVTSLAGKGRTYPGFVDGTNSSARFNHPYGVTLDAAGNLYVADTYNQTIRKLSPQGTNWIVTTIAGTAGSAGSTDGTNSNARFNGPASIIFNAASGNFYLADFGNNTIRALTPSGTNWIVTTLAGQAGTSGGINGTNGNARFDGPAGIAMDTSGNLYVADSFGNTIRVLKRFGTNWVVNTLAGLQGVPGFANGTGPAARFQQPSGLAVDATGRAFVADTANYTLRSGQLAIVLQAGLLPGQIGLSWPTGAVGYVLESAPSVVGASWKSISNGIATVGDNFVYNTNTTAPRTVFRLHKP